MTDTATVVPNVDLIDGTTIPQLGYGVWQVPDAIASECVQEAIAAGYRSIDTAMIYDNERGVGEGVRASGVPRDELYITTKLWNSDQGRGTTRAALEASLERLGMDRVDLYLMHWPAPRLGKYIEAWEVMIDAQADGLATAIGVSNFNAQRITDIVDATGVVPVLNQVELHPYWQQSELRRAHAGRRIATEAWSPLGRGGPLLEEPTLAAIARTHGVTVAQVVIRWHLQLGNIVIPKSATPARIRENFDVFGFALSAGEMDAIATLDDPAGRIGPDPENTSF